MSNRISRSSRRRSPSYRSALLLLLAVLGTSGLARLCAADEDQNVSIFNQRYRSGTDAYEKQDYELAIKQFQLAYSIKLEPLLLYNIAQCHRKLNHDGEAITYYQSFLNTPETTDRELRAKAGRYLTDLREKHLAQLEPQLIYVETTRKQRPIWRIGLGSGLLAVSAVLLGFGGAALDVNGSCVDSATGGQLKCNNIVDTAGLGTGLVVGGILAAIGGVVTIAIPGHRNQVQRSGSPTTRQVVKPLAAVFPAGRLVVGRSGLQAGLAF